MRVNIISFYSKERTKYQAQYSLFAERIGAYAKKCLPQLDLCLSAYEMEQEDRAVAEDILATDSQIVAFPGYMWTNEKSSAIAKIIEEQTKDTLIVCGGPEVTSFRLVPWSERCLFVAGQGEEPFSWLCQQKIKDSNFDGRSLTSTDPFPVFSVGYNEGHIRELVKKLGNRDDIPAGISLYSDEMLALYKKPPSIRFAWQETARGCVFKCGFCSHKTLSHFAVLDIKHVEQEFRDMARYGIQETFINDPIIGGWPRRGKEVLRLLGDVAPSMKQMFYVRPEFLDDEFVSLMAQLNTSEVHVGLQTINPAVPRFVRANNLNKIQKYLPQLSQNGIKWRAELITGLPGDTMQGTRDSIAFVIDQLKPTFFYAYQLSALPDTKIESLVNNIGDPYWLRVDDDRKVIETSTASAQEITDMVTYSSAMCSLYMTYREAADEGTYRGNVSFNTLTDKIAPVLNNLNVQEKASLRRLTINQPKSKALWDKYGIAPK